MTSRPSNPNLTQEWNDLFTSHQSSKPTTIDDLCALNLASNTCIGPPLIEIKPADTTRVYFVNPNGFNLSSEGGQFKEWISNMQHIDADLMGAAEHNIDTTNARARSLCYDAAKTTFRNSKLVLASSAIPAYSTYKPGGTLLLTQGNLTGRLINSGSDYMGRWSFTRFAGSRGKIVTVIIAYQVCNKPVITGRSKGSSTVAAQQASMLFSGTGSRVHPRAQFRTDLTQFLTTCQTDHESILLLGDFNESLGADASGMSKICSNLALTDLCLQHHGSDDFSTYVRGSTRLDYALASPSIAAACRSCGYEPFLHRTKGDHRGLYLDFSTASLFGNETQKIAPPNLRDINSKDRASNRKYIEAKYNYLADHHWFERVQALNQLNDCQPALAESIDADWIRGSMHASKTCKVKPNYAWSLKLIQQRACCNILRRVLSSVALRMDFTATITKLSADAPPGFLLPSSIQACKVAYRQAQKLLREMERSSANYRRTEHNEKLAKLRATSNSKGIKDVKLLIKAEEVKQMYQKLRNIQGSQKSSITRLLVPEDPTANPKTCTEWRSVDLPNEIATHLRNRNRKHFGQAHGTPPTIPPLSEHIDWAASTAEAELILTGDYDATELDTISQLLVRHMKAKTPLDIITNHITLKDWIGKLQVWKESTSTSPSGLHLGHHKALVSPHDLDLDSEAGGLLETKRLALLQAQVDLLNYALRSGYSYERWQQIVNVMILKEPNNIKIHRLRVLHLYEADYALLLGVKWRELIHHGVDNNHLHRSQYGCLPGKDSLVPAFIEELQNEISRASRKPQAKADFDATSCFDRIIPNLASIFSRQHGMHRNVCLVHANTLAEVKYLLKTQLGISDATYQHCKIFPIYGTGQGSTNSPAIWVIVCSALFDAHESAGHGALYETPDRTVSLRINMVGFVDDTSGSVNQFSQNTPPSPYKLVELMQSDAQLWSDLLHTSGGALELSKCSYHIMFYDFTSSGAPVLRGGQIGPTIQVQSGDRSSSDAFSALSAYTSHKTLGVHKEPSGSQLSAKRAISANSDKKSSIVARSPLDRHESWTFYHSIYLPSITYPLPVGNISEKDFAKIESRATRRILPKCGYNRNTPKTVIYGPHQFGGIEFRRLYVEQGLGQLTFFLKFWRTDFEAGHLLRIATAWNQNMAGTGSSILTDVSTPLPHLETKWIPSLRTFLHSINGSLELDHTYVPALQREHDFHIMDIVLSQATYTPRELRLINYCRLYLQASTASDICLPCGRFLDPAILKGVPSTLSSISLHHHTVQPRPHAAAWSLWRRALRLFSTRPGKLCHPLGRWLLSGPSLRRSWPTYVSIKRKILLVRTSHGFSSYPRQGPRHYSASPSRTLRRLPPDSLPVSFDQEAAPHWLVLPSPRLAPTFPIRTPATFAGFLASLPQWETNLFPGLTLLFPPFRLLELIQASAETFFGVSDGSVALLRGTFGWALSLPCGTRLATCAGNAPGFFVTSFRAEGYGLLSMARFLLHLFAFCHLPIPPRISLSTDNEGLVTRIATCRACAIEHPNTSLKPDWDVVRSIADTLLLFPAPKITHVKGHQDKTVPYADLPLRAQLNVDADHLAGEFHATFSPTPERVTRLGSNPVQFHLPSGTITSKVKQVVRKAATTPPLQDYICESTLWSPQTFDAVDWLPHGQALKRCYTKKSFLVKFLHNLLPTGKRVHRYAVTYCHRCPTCHAPQEDRSHLLQCPHPSRIAWINDLFVALRARCASLRTREVLLDLLITGIDCWINDTAFPYHRFPSASVQPLLAQQDSIGWDQLLLGRFGLHWRFLQDDHLRSFHNTPSFLSGSSWVLAVTQIIWDHIILVWDRRNADRHGSDAATRLDARRDQALRETSALYDRRHDILAKDKDIFHKTFAHHQVIEKTAYRLTAWLNTWRPVILRSIRDADRLHLRNTPTIRQMYYPERDDHTLTTTPDSDSDSSDSTSSHAFPPPATFPTTIRGPPG